MNNELLLARQTSELARLNKARFVATVSHELRGPLNLILGFSRLMALSPERYGSPLPPSYRADIDTIYTNSRHLVALLDDILDLSQIEAEHLPLIRERVDLGRDVIEHTALAVRPLIERKGLTLDIDLDNSMPMLLGDRLRLRQVLINLLTNAVRYTEHGGITVRSRIHPDGALVTVEDTGRGIAPDQLPKLFQEFQQLSFEDGQRQGTGLGLAISKHLVQMHAGRIWAESTEGQGTQFHFLVPFPGDMSSTWSVARTSERQPATRRSECVLILHDDARTIRMLARHLDGFRVVALPRAADLAPLVEELFPRAVVAAPNEAEDAWQILQGLPYDVPIIACQLPEYGQRHALPNVTSYLIKPISPEVVQASLHQARHLEQEGTVLLVDDDPDAVRLLEAILTNLPRPYRILRAYDGEQALAIMAEQTPDLVFADQVMPGIDGLQMADLMYQDMRLCKVPVVVISARDPEEEPPAFRTPFSIRCKAPIPMAAGIGVLRELLSVFRPSYLGASGSPEPSAAADRGQSVS
jgi:CheY-like chemotaxis protein